MTHLAYLTAFEPFGGRARNRSWEVARRVPRPAGVELVQLPVNFARLRDAIDPLLAAGPRAILLLGEAPIAEVAVEEVAINWIHAIGDDNAGNAPRGLDVVPGAPLALRADWDAATVAMAIRSQGIPARASFHAGTFACNAALYHALYARPGGRGPGGPHARLTGEAFRTAVGFLHLPRSYRGKGTELAALVRAVEVGLSEILRSPPD